MGCFKIKNKIMLTVNAVIISAICILNYFYQRNGFDYLLKCLCSGSFALLGIINLSYALIAKQSNIKFYVGMFAGLLLAFLGDVLIDCGFIIGTTSFAIGHICFLKSYCFLEKFSIRDLIPSGILFFGTLIFLLFCPLLTFEVSFFKYVCIAYALIISFMVGKAISNFIKEQNALTINIVIASILFFISDLMLVFGWFIGRWNWTGYACMGTYYPALCLLGFAMYIKTTIKKRY